MDSHMLSPRISTASFSTSEMAVSLSTSVRGSQLVYCATVQVNDTAEIWTEVGVMPSVVVVVTGVKFL